MEEKAVERYNRDREHETQKDREKGINMRLPGEKESDCWRYLGGSIG